MNSEKKIPPITVIDLGSNTFHGAVFKFHETQGLQILESHKEFLRFASAIGASKIISQDVIDRGILTIKTIMSMTKEFDCPIKGVATHAIRSSRNFEDFLFQIEKATGLKVEIVDGSEEARLCYIGMRSSLDLFSKETVGIDLGGGSTEILLAKDDELKYVTSLNLGAISIYDKFLKRHAEKRKAPKKAIKSLKDYLTSRFFPISFEIKDHKSKLAVASSGTARALCHIDFFLKNQSKLDEPNGYVLSLERLRVLEQHLTKLWTGEKISDSFKLEKRRAETVLVGTLIYLAIAEVFKLESFTISSSGFREGVALDWYSKNYGIGPDNFRDLREKSVRNFGKKFGLDPQSAESTRTLTRAVFQKLSEVMPKNLPDDKKSILELVEAGGYLHSVGKIINPSSFHKHSYYLISESSFLGYSQEERHLIALMIRFSRKKPARLHKSLKKPYLKENLALVNFLSSCLRIARVFTRRIPSCLKSIDFSVSHSKLLITITRVATFSLEIEIQLLSREIHYLEEALGIDIELITC